MKSIAVTAIIFGLIFGAALAGMAVRPTHDPLGSEAKEVVRLTTGLITTMTGLVLGMLVSSAKAIYDAAACKFSPESVHLDSYTETNRPLDFPVLMRDDRVVSCLDASATLKNVPIVAVDFVFIAPQLRE